ncbi:MAG: penicillin-binding protein 2 [Pseudomonadota bacterium]
MSRLAVSITASVAPSGTGARWSSGGPRLKLRSLVVVASIALAFIAIGGQLVWLASRGAPPTLASLTAPAATSFSRPDIVDRKGRLLASDVEIPSLFADPQLVVDRDEAVEKLSALFRDLDSAGLRAELAAAGKRFVWVRRGLAPAVAQRVHELGLPGFAFRNELRRAYPAGALAGHALGTVDIDNRGLAGIERAVDDMGAAEPIVAAQLTSRAPIVAALDTGVQHALESELSDAVMRHAAKGAAGLVLDVDTGEVIATASLPTVDPADPTAAQSPAKLDRIAGGSYELGSIFKTFTVAMALEEGGVGLDTMVDTTAPLEVGRFRIDDLHPAGRPLTVAEVFVRSSNVGAAQLALAAGPERQRRFLERLGLTRPMSTDVGPVAPPQVPARWDRAETITISYGHGIAVAPLQLAAAAAALVNGGYEVAPTYLKRAPVAASERKRVVSAETSARIRELMRRNVAEPGGTGRRAAAEGYRVGGKTGTAELAVAGGYDKRAVLSSFLAAFPIDAPRYLTLVLLFEPKPAPETGGVTGGLTAAPVTSRVVSRIAPLLGVLPESKGL